MAHARRTATIGSIIHASIDEARTLGQRLEQIAELDRRPIGHECPDGYQLVVPRGRWCPRCGWNPTAPLNDPAQVARALVAAIPPDLIQPWLRALTRELDHLATLQPDPLRYHTRDDWAPAA